jgi:hypothetical protein
MMTSHFDAVAQTERALLGSILYDNSVWPQTSGLSLEDFSLDTHRKIFARMAAMFEDQRPADSVTVMNELAQLNQLDSCGGPEYLASLIDDAMPENCAAYIRDVRRASLESRAGRHIELMAMTRRTQSPDKLAKIREQAQQLDAMLSDDFRGEQWKALFHTYDEMMNAPPARFAIDGFLQEEGITLIGGLAGHGKTLCMLAMVRALLEGGKLFHHFAVNKTAQRVLYLIPEAGLGPFAARLKTFHLLDHVRDGRLHCRTLSAPGSLLLNDPRLLEAVKGADVFLDTAVRFMVGDENSATEQKVFAETLFALQRAGARTITGAHHSPKSFGKDTIMTLENVLRGSGDIGAMLCSCWGLSQIDAASNRIFIQNVKARDFLPCEPFIIQGRRSIDQSGYFELTHPPGFAGRLSDNKPSVGRPELAERDSKAIEARRMKEEGASLRDIASALSISKSSVERLLSPKQ